MRFRRVGLQREKSKSGTQKTSLSNYKTEQASAQVKPYAKGKNIAHHPHMPLGYFAKNILSAQRWLRSHSQVSVELREEKRSSEHVFK